MHSSAHSDSGKQATAKTDSKDVKQFSADHCGKAVMEYIFTLEQLSDRRWDSIMGKLFPEPTEDESFFTGLSSLSENCCNIYIPSSP
ncbi:hypothetical protein HWV62_8659 [Athelia sp. TMB]|nr:hypothetical protein HWV62_8659 [Athelia sp. TMB]